MFFFFFKQKTAYEVLRSLVGSESCIRDRTRYPASIHDLEFVLSQITFYNDLTVNQVLNLFLFSDMEYRDRKSFDWRFGEDAFEIENNVS